MLNFPKTGSSYARAVIKKLYTHRETLLQRFLCKLDLCKPPVLEYKMPKIDESRSYDIVDQHGTLRQIPPRHRDKPVVSITRNPFLRYVSNYLYRWWERYPPADTGVIRRKFPTFPRLSFEEYYEMSHQFSRANRLGELEPCMDLGTHSVQFIQFYFHEPEDVLRRLDASSLRKGSFRNNMGDVTFLHQEHLTSELRDFLLKMGAARYELVFLGSMEPVNVTEPEGSKDKRKDYWRYYKNPDLVEKLLQRDALLFALFPEYRTEAERNL